MKVSTILASLAKLKINLACFIFVIYQTHNCVQKFLDGPRSTSSSIKHASLYPYTDISFCADPYDKLIASKLKNCNLTTEDYFQNNIWIGNGTESYCNDPAELFETLKEGVQSMIYGAIMFGFSELNNDIIYIDNETFWEAKEQLDFGVCFTFNIPKHQDIWKIDFFLDKSESLIAIFSPPKNFIATFDRHLKILRPGYLLYINMEHEVSKVLDLNGQRCTEELQRDDCVYEYLHKVKYFKYLHTIVNH